MYYYSDGPVGANATRRVPTAYAYDWVLPTEVNEGRFYVVRVTALDGALVLSDGADQVTITTGAATDVTYTGATDALTVADWVDGASVTLTDANGLVDSITVASQAGKSLGAVESVAAQWYQHVVFPPG